MDKKKKIIAIAALVLVLTLIFTKNFILKPNDTDNLFIEERGVVTNLISIEKHTLVEDLTFLGTIESDGTATMSSKVTSDVLSIHVREGEHVKKDDVLISLNKRQFLAQKETLLTKKATLQSQLSYLKMEVSTFHQENPIMAKIASIEGTLKYKQGELDKYSILYEAGAISQSEFEQMQHQVANLQHQKNELMATSNNSYNQLVQEKNMVTHQLEELRAALNEVEISLLEAEIRAPFDGQVREILIEQGDLALTGNPLVKLDKIDKVKVITKIGEIDLKKLKKGMEAEVTPADQEVTYSGKVSFMSTNVNSQTRIGTVEVTLDEPASNFVMGTSANIRFILNQEYNQLLIPVEAVKELTHSKVVYVYGNDQRVYERAVTLGLKVGNFYQVIDGLEEGESIAVRNLDALYDGATIFSINGEVE